MLLVAWCVQSLNASINNMIGDRKMATTKLSDLSESKKAQVRKALAGGNTQAQVADKFGLSVASVRRINGYVEPAKRNGQGVAEKPAKASGKKAGERFNAESFGSKPTAKAPAKTVTKPPKVKVDKGVGVVDIAVVKAAELHRWLSDVQPFRGYDDTLPMLTGTHVEWDGKRFLAATTDRFTLGISRLDVPETGVSNGLGEADFMLEAKDVASILRIAKTAKRDSDWRHVTISRVGEIPAGCTVPTFTYRFTFFSGETLTVKPFDVEFPKFKQLIPSGEPVARALSAFTVDYLAKFAKVTTDRVRRIQLYSFDDNEFGGAKPTVALIGDNFIGLIMPVRCEDAKWVKPGWIA
jgi:hypothetical protein